jgi:glycosyltransferase involved in cell wall biosynthesis
MQKDSGASVRIYNLARGLSSRGNSVKVIMPGKESVLKNVDGIEVHFVSGFLPSRVLGMVSKFVGVARPTALYFYDLLFILKLQTLIREADFLQFEGPAGGLLTFIFRRYLKKKVVVDCHDVFQALRLQQTGLLRRILETFLEKLAYKNADLLLTVSEGEKEYLISTGFQRRKIEVIPNGVDTKLFVKSSEQIETRKKYGVEGFHIVIFVGNLEYMPNREAIQALSSIIAPKVRNKIEDVKFLVVGKSRDRMQLPGLTFTGFVENVSEILSISDVAVAPLFHGSGTRLKLLEYFSSSLPVVSTSIGAEGLAIKNGVDIFIEDDLESFSLRVVELLKNKKLSKALGEAARVLVTTTYEWTQITKGLDIVLNSLIDE